MAGEAPALSHALHADVFELAQSDGALVWPDHAAGYPARLLQKCAPADCQYRALCRAVQPAQTSIRLDGNRRFHPSESGSAMQSYFWDRTLGAAEGSGRRLGILESRMRASPFVSTIEN